MPVPSYRILILTNQFFFNSHSSQEVERNVLELLNANKWNQVIDICMDWFKKDPDNFMITKALVAACYHSGKKIAKRNCLQKFNLHT